MATKRRKKGQKMRGLSERRTGADPLILDSRDWNAAEIDSEKSDWKWMNVGGFMIYDFRVVGEEGEGRSFAAQWRRWMAGIEVE